MIHFSQVSKQFGNSVLFQNVSFFLPKSSYTYVDGEHGSGKTSLIKLMMGEIEPDTGTVTVNDLDLSSLPSDRVPFFRRQISCVKSAPTLLENLSTSQNVQLALEIAGYDRRETQERTYAKLEALGLIVIAEVPVQRLNTSQRWLVACARATVHSPAVLLIDEPDSPIESSARIRQQELTEQMATDGTTVVVITKQLEPQAMAANSRRLQLIQGTAIHHEHTNSSEAHHQL